MEFIDLKAQYRALKPEIDANIQAVLDAGQFIGGPYVKELERQLAEYVGRKHCISCGNGHRRPSGGLYGPWALVRAMPSSARTAPLSPRWSPQTCWVPPQCSATCP